MRCVVADKKDARVCKSQATIPRHSVRPPPLALAAELLLGCALLARPQCWWTRSRCEPLGACYWHGALLTCAPFMQPQAANVSVTQVTVVPCLYQSPCTPEHQPGDGSDFHATTGLQLGIS